MSLIFHCELTRINFCLPRSSTGKWVVLRRELGGNAVDKKFVAEGIVVGYQEDPRWAKKSTPPVWGDFEKPPELYCRYIGKISPAPWRPCFLTNPNGLNNLDRGSPKEHFCKIILKSVQWFLTRKFLKFSI